MDTTDVCRVVSNLRSVLQVVARGDEEVLESGWAERAIWKLDGLHRWLKMISADHQPLVQDERFVHLLTVVHILLMCVRIPSSGVWLIHSEDMGRLKYGEDLNELLDGRRNWGEFLRGCGLNPEEFRALASAQKGEEEESSSRGPAA